MLEHLSSEEKHVLQELKKSWKNDWAVSSFN